MALLWAAWMAVWWVDYLVDHLAAMTECMMAESLDLKMADWKAAQMVESSVMTMVGN